MPYPLRFRTLILYGIAVKYSARLSIPRFIDTFVMAYGQRPPARGLCTRALLSETPYPLRFRTLILYGIAVKYSARLSIPRFIDTSVKAYGQRPPARGLCTRALFIRDAISATVWYRPSRAPQTPSRHPCRTGSTYQHLNV